MELKTCTCIHTNYDGAYATIGRGSQKFIRPCTIVFISIFGITCGKLHLCEYIYVGINTVSINQSIERV